VRARKRRSGWPARRLKPGEAQARYQLGEIALASGDLAEARRQHEQALALRQEMKETRTMLESQLALAAIALEDGRPADAESQAQNVIGSLKDRRCFVRRPISSPHAPGSRGTI
jgi:tetratricopeptide (TPR) repeat protein